MKAKQETRKQVMKRIDKLMSDQALGHLICRTCGVSGCCILAHDNLLPRRPGDRFEKDGRIRTFHGHKFPFSSEPVSFERTGGFIDEDSVK